MSISICPDCLVPPVSPGPRNSTQFQVDLGDFEAVVGAAHGFHASLAIVGQLMVGDEDAIGLVGATTHTTSQLMQLGQAEAVGVLDNHHRGVGDVHAHLDDGCGYHDLCVPIDKALHLEILVLGSQPTVADTEFVLRLGEVVQQGLIALLQCNHIRVLRLLDARIDHINLSPKRNLLLHEHHDAVAVIAIDMVSLHRLSARRQLIDFGDIKVAILRHGEGAWDRRGGHHQSVGRNFGFLVEF